MQKPTCLFIPIYNFIRLVHNSISKLFFAYKIPVSFKAEAVEQKKKIYIYIKKL